MNVSRITLILDELKCKRLHKNAQRESSKAT